MTNEIEERIGQRKLIWFGTRGSDALSLTKIEQFAGVFSMIAPLGMASWAFEQEACLEELSGKRLDLNAYRIDEDTSEATAELHRQMMNALLPGSVVAAYRSCHFISAACYSAGERSELLSMFHGMQAAFDYKPWVESSLESQGIRVIPWHYYSDYDWHLVNERSSAGPYVLRSSYTDGGLGLRRLMPGDKMDEAPPRLLDRLVALAPDLQPNTPLNVGACVFPDGTITVHAPSVQLIGIAECTDLPYGYCGNDFALVNSALSPERLEDLEDMVVQTGRWLHSHGYRGAFGVDALLYRDTLYLAEVNARFQGSSAASAEIAAALSLSDVFLDHLASLLGASCDMCRPTLREQAEMQATQCPKSQIVAYSIDTPQKRRPDAPVPDFVGGRVMGAPSSGRITIEPNGMLFKLVLDRSATSSGFEIDADTRDQIVTLRYGLFENA